MDIENEVATLEEIGSRLAAAGKAQNAQPEHVMPQIGANRATWYSWTKGESEAGCRKLAMLGLLLGLRPDELLLKNPGVQVAAGSDIFTSQDYSNLAQAHRLMAALERINKSDTRVTQTILDLVSDVAHQFGIADETVPPGTVVEHDPEMNLRTYEPPPPSRESSAEGEASPPAGAGAAGEAVTPYGRKTRRRK